MSAGIQHLIKGGRESNRIGEARVDKLEADGFNSIVERISGVNPSKIAATITGAKVDTAPRPRAAVSQPAAGPGPRLGSQAPWEESSGGNATVDQLAKQVQMLERRLAKYEVFNGNDNDVVSTTTTPAASLNRGADSSAYGSGAIRKKNAKSKDPVDGKPDKKTEPNMAGERVNILGVSMDEWRSLAGLSAPVLKAPAIVESYEDEDEIEEARTKAQQDAGHAALATKHGQEYGSKAWFNQSDADGDRAYRAGNKAKKHGQVASRDSEGISARVANRIGAKGRRGDALAFRKPGMAMLRAKYARGVKKEDADMIEQELWAEFLLNYDMTPAEFAEFVEAADDAGDEEALLAVMELEDEFIEAIGAEADAPIEEDVDQLWSQWLEARDLSVETFNALVDAVETEEDISTLESLQAMFEAEVLRGTSIAGSAPGPGDKELAMPGKAPQKLTSLARGDAKPSRKGNFSLPASMRAKMGLPKEEEGEVDEDDEAFECDDDGNGHPDMKHPGWAKAMSKFKKSGRKS